MEHVVFFPAPDGSPAFRRVPSLEEAVRMVEHLRNVDGVASVSVHSLTEVPLAFRAYYRVEVPTDGMVPTQAVVEQEAPQAVEVFAAVEVEAAEAEAAPIGLEPEPVVAEVPALALVEDAPADEDEDRAASNGHAETAPASLGFFA